jgi:hypothetical protein
MDPERTAHCASCRAAIPPDAQVYTLRVDLFASARPPEFDEVDLLADHRKQWESLIEKMSEMTPREAEEEGDKVFERYVFSLCGQCRAELHDHFKSLTS